jgi:hypothetical protein
MIEDIRRKSVTCVTEQGIGDTFWAYQKLAPFYRGINFILGIGAIDVRQCRANEMVKLLPKVSSVTYQIVDHYKYQEIGTMKKSLKPFLDQRLEFYEYSVTQYIRDGVRIDDIDPGLPIAWDVPLPLEKVDLPFRNYIGLTASGPGTADRKDVWRPDRYIELIKLIKATYGMPKDFPVVIFGASYDKWIIEEFESRLEKDKVPHASFIDFSWEKIFYLLKHCTFFLGFNSGLHVLADNLDVPQLMIIFDEIPGARYAFAKKANIASGVYNATLFGRTLKQIIDEDIRIPELPGGFKRLK